MQLAHAYLILYGPPTLLAASPGIIAVLKSRPRLGFLQMLMALIVTFPLSIYLDRLETAELTANGHIADSLFFIFRPWLHAFIYGVVSAFIIAIASMFLPEAPKKRRVVETPVQVAPWIGEMRREREPRDPPAS
jgi:hypothetical protein